MHNAQEPCQVQNMCKTSWKIPKGDNQNVQIKGQTTQWPKDTKEIIKMCKSKDRQLNDQKITKG